MQLSKLTEVNFCDWDKVVDSSKNGVFLFKIDFFKYHEEKFNDESLIIYKKNKPVAIFPANGISDVLYTHSGLTYGGLVYGQDLHAKDVILIFQSLRLYYKDKGYKKIIYKLIPSIFRNYPSDEDVYALFINKTSLIRRDLSSVIELKNRPKFSDSRKNTIQKAKKNNVIINLSADFASFHLLLSSVLAKFGAQPVHSAEELILLASRFPNNINLYTAKKDEEIIAGCLVFDFGCVVHTQYLASSPEGRTLGALDYLLATLIQQVYQEKKYFSFGISTEQSGTFLNEGLIAQKEGFGGRGIVHDFYEWDLSND
ncbi:GNAT family N-acetyltransferase [Candidatus Symbiopectobacterium sp. NZEC151]|uniref:GNAT family N-acetyltransferase n=2 Tax=unclassified Symbiopectobacterium TaxID=2794573 RepID=UPI0022262BF4|nr:GNAT family N-acetyltransferase [Candidatus Symbiopectobacterium sp. NZEC151]MCW2473043.1 GNAT family N-acetyltransferase [Candidatus Symbiopectobacterium sp. NZEC151]